MSLTGKIAAKQKTASGPAQGSAMEKNVPIVGESAPSKSNAQQNVTRNQNFTVKGLGWNKTNSGY